MARRPETPMAAAMQWVARITAAALMMFLPGLGGQWLDGRLETRFLTIVGFALGLVGGMAYLIAATRQADAERKADHEGRSDRHDVDPVERH